MLSLDGNFDRRGKVKICPKVMQQKTFKRIFEIFPNIRQRKSYFIYFLIIEYSLLLVKLLFMTQ